MPWRPLLAVCLAAAACGAARADEPRPPELRVGKIEIAGRTLEAEERLAPFLGTAPGARFDEKRLVTAAEDLGYHVVQTKLETRDDGAVYGFVELSPRRIVRHVSVKGNFPLFDDEIRRRLSLRPGAPLPPPEREAAHLAEEEKRVADYLRRQGYFDGGATVVLEPAGRPEWVNVRVKVRLGRWTSVGSIRTVYPERRPREDPRARALTDREMQSRFRPGALGVGWFGRFRLDQMREDARIAEERMRERGYPAARVLPRWEMDAKSGRANLAVEVTQKGKVKLVFRGARALSERELRSKVTIFTSGSYDPVELQESARELHRLYQSHGYLEARIAVPRPRTLQQPQPDGRVDETVEITFVIDEGPELRVGDVEVLPEPGRPALFEDPASLRAILSTKRYTALGALRLVEGGVVTNIQLAQDVEKLVTHYRTRGYPLARVRAEAGRTREGLDNVGVLGAEAAGAPSGSSVLVRFFVDEGPRETIDSVELSYARGEHERSTAALLAALKLRPGDPFTATAITAGLQRIVDSYAEMGHPYAKVDAQGSTWNEDHTRIVLRVFVNEGPEVRFGPVVIRGNFKTAESVIYTDLPFRPGDRFDARRLARAERNLQSHGIFNGARVVPYGLADGVNPVPVLVEVQERYDDWGTPLLTLGYATDIGLSEALGYYWGNVLGGGGSLELRAEAAEDLARWQGWAELGSLDNPFWRLLSVSARYVHPHLGHPSLRAEANGFWRKENTVRLGRVISYGGGTSLSWVASRSLRLFLRLDVTSSSLQNIDIQRLPVRGDWLTAEQDQTLIWKVTLGTIFDSRVSTEGLRNPLLPARGWLVGGTLAYEFVHRFFVVAAQVQRYQPLGKGFTLIANLRGDWGIPLEGPALPAVERFFGGGDTTTRGFDTDKLKTEIIRGDVSPAGSGAAYRIIPQGGNIRFLGTLELQFPIAKLAGYDWVGALFVDAGTIFNEPALVKGSDIKVSVGITLLRILTPVGPLSLEYAYPITQTLAEEQWRKETSWWQHWPGRIHFNWGIPILR